MPKKYWLPADLPSLYAMFVNVLAKIADYQAALGLTAAQVTEIEEICTNFIAAYEFVESCKAKMKSLTEWRDFLFYGTPMGDALPAAPIFAVLGALTGTIGIVDRFKEIRGLIVNLPGYTIAIGEDLMIEGEEEGPAPEGSLVPELKITVGPAYSVTVKVSLKGNDQVRIEYRPVGGPSWSVVGEPTTTPFSFCGDPSNPRPTRIRPPPRSVPEEERRRRKLFTRIRRHSRRMIMPTFRHSF